MSAPLGKLILASASPRRRELLEAAGWQVEARPADIDETPRPGETAAALVLRLARAKARLVAAQAGPQRIVLGADTEVVVGRRILGKPRDAAAAAVMLRALSGRSHRVLTGVSLRHGRREQAWVETTRVWFNPLSDADIAAYAASGEPLDKAGGYAIQGWAARFIPRIAGSYSNVVGLPLASVWERWRRL